MTVTNRLEKLIELYTTQLHDELDLGSRSARPTYGFEYEFLPKEPLNLDRMKTIHRLLPRLGYKDQENLFMADNLLYITFEPGGQIEYGSPPLEADDRDRFNRFLVQIEQTNETIKQQLGIEYLATGFLPGRADVPLCLEADRYFNMHRRMEFSGTRGREMMKGTASIQLHAAFTGMEEMLVLYKELCLLADGKEFGMGSERADIWAKTDPSRCGTPCLDWQELSDSHQLVRSIVTHTLCAEDLYMDRPFYELPEQDFHQFLVHLTTIFTNIRLNLKGPTVELRTPESSPGSQLSKIWWRFIEIVESKR